MKIELDYIEKLAKIVAENELTEVTLEDEETTVTMKKEKEVVSAQVSPVVQSQVAAVPTQEFNVVTEDVKNESKGVPITSPMVGTFYKASSPGDAPFVEVGKTVGAGQVVCIIEAMKLMNEIESEVAGKVIEVCVEDGQPVEYGEVLMYVEPQ